MADEKGKKQIKDSFPLPVLVEEETIKGESYVI